MNKTPRLMEIDDCHHVLRVAVSPRQFKGLLLPGSIDMDIKLCKSAINLCLWGMGPGQDDT